MRLRRKREPRTEPEPSHLIVGGDCEIDSTAPVLWSVEQLNALGPMTGPSHRTFVPIVRGPLNDSSLGFPTDSTNPPSQL
jgi:hypothetical protein